MGGLAGGRPYRLISQGPAPRADGMGGRREAAATPRVDPQPPLRDNSTGTSPYQKPGRCKF
jgi:hypothetical protein